VTGEMMYKVIWQSVKEGDGYLLPSSEAKRGIYSGGCVRFVSHRWGLANQFNAKKISSKVRIKASEPLFDVDSQICPL